MISTVVHAFTNPLTSFGATAAQGFVAAVGATSVGVCICCVPYVDTGPLSSWATTTAPGAQQAVHASATDGTVATRDAASASATTTVRRTRAVVPSRQLRQLSEPVLEAVPDVAAVARVGGAVSPVEQHAARAAELTAGLPGAGR